MGLGKHVEIPKAGKGALMRVGQRDAAGGIVQQERTMLGRVTFGFSFRNGSTKTMQAFNVAILGGHAKS